MNPGRLNRRIIVQRQSETQDEVGQPVLTWTDYAFMWADVRVLGGIEAIKAGAVTSTVRASIRVRMVAGINAGMRVLLGESAYNITAVLPDEAGRRHMDLLCEVAQ